ncbi:MAG: prevent-host-death protein [Deltaproteobacteria bacterium]|nr:prevent-host-death protein [Deltaproteobacteria bacterium]
MEKVKKGEQIVISYGKKREKIAMIVPYPPHFDKPERKIGLLKGQASCTIYDDFHMSDEEVLDS